LLTSSGRTYRFDEPREFRGAGPSAVVCCRRASVRTGSRSVLPREARARPLFADSEWITRRSPTVPAVAKGPRWCRIAVFGTCRAYFPSSRGKPKAGGGLDLDTYADGGCGASANLRDSVAREPLLVGIHRGVYHVRPRYCSADGEGAACGEHTGRARPPKRKKKKGQVFITSSVGGLAHHSGAFSCYLPKLYKSHCGEAPSEEPRECNGFKHRSHCRRADHPSFDFKPPVGCRGRPFSAPFSSVLPRASR